MAETSTSPDSSRLACRDIGCGGAPATPDGRCLAHTDHEELRRLLADASRSRALDARGVTLDAGLLSRMLALAPIDAQGRPRFKCIVFEGATFLGPTRLGGVAFTDASFDGATFKGDTSFDGAVFDGQARFGGACFERKADFAAARFESNAWFPGVSFAGDADFVEARFGGPVWFSESVFAADALFSRTSFAGDAAFDETRFGCHAVFAEADFERNASLATATFKNPARYDDARFRGPSGAPPSAARHTVWSGAPLASWSTRAASALIDLAVPAGFVVAALALAAVSEGLSYRGLLPALLAIAVAAGIFFTVRNLIDQGLTGQTLGKRTMGLSLVRKADGLPVGPRISLLRYALHVVDAAPLFLGLLVPAWSSTRQTFADRIATTMVVRQRGWAGANPARPRVAVGGYG